MNMNKRQAKKKNKNQFDEYCRNYKEERIMKKFLEKAKREERFRVKSKEIIELNIEW